MNNQTNNASSQEQQILSDFSKCIGTPVTSPQVQNLVEQWKGYISQSYYNCDNDTFQGIGIMYGEDQNLKKNLDVYGKGTADYISSAIKVYCENHR